MRGGWLVRSNVTRELQTKKTCEKKQVIVHKVTQKSITLIVVVFQPRFVSAKITVPESGKRICDFSGKVWRPTKTNGRRQEGRPDRRATHYKI